MEQYFPYIIMILMLTIMILIFSILKAMSSIIDELKYSTVALLNSNNEIKEEMKNMANPYNQFDSIE